MSAQIVIKNDGPEEAAVQYFDGDQGLTKVTRVLQVGESVTLSLWDGGLPLLLPGAATADAPT